MQGIVSNSDFPSFLGDLSDSIGMNTMDYAQILEKGRSTYNPGRLSTWNDPPILLRKLDAVFCEHLLDMGQLPADFGTMKGYGEKYYDAYADAAIRTIQEYSETYGFGDHTTVMRAEYCLRRRPGCDKLCPFPILTISFGEALIHRFKRVPKAVVEVRGS